MGFPKIPGHGKKSPSQSELQDMRRRMNQGPRIAASQATADDGVARGSAAQQKADEAHSRFTNAALDTAHTAAETAQVKADGAYSRTTNVSLDNAHLKAEARLSRADGGTVPGVSKFNNFLEEDTLTNTTLNATSTITYTTAARIKHLAMAHVQDGTLGFIPLPTVGSTPIFVVKNNADASFNFGIKNARSTAEVVHARLWSEAY